MESDIQKVPEWVKKLEEKRSRPHKLAHEIGAGAPCLACGDACPGLDLHFWRKTCRNCKCGKEKHDVQENDYGYQFELLLGAGHKKTIRKTYQLHMQGIKGADGHKTNDPISFDWLPPDISPDVAERYMRQIPESQRPICGTEGAQKRREQLERQVPLYDVDPSHCHSLTEAEIFEFEKYRQHLKEGAVGQGRVAILSSMLKELRLGTGIAAQEAQITAVTKLEPLRATNNNYDGSFPSPPSPGTLLHLQGPADPSDTAPPLPNTLPPSMQRPNTFLPKPFQKTNYANTPLTSDPNQNMLNYPTFTEDGSHGGQNILDPNYSASIGGARHGSQNTFDPSYLVSTGDVRHGSRNTVDPNYPASIGDARHDSRNIVDPNYAFFVGDAKHDSQNTFDLDYPSSIGDARHVNRNTFDPSYPTFVGDVRYGSQNILDPHAASIGDVNYGIQNTIDPKYAASIRDVNYGIQNTIDPKYAASIGDAKYGIQNTIDPKYAASIGDARHGSRNTADPQQQLFDKKKQDMDKLQQDILSGSRGFVDRNNLGLSFKQPLPMIEEVKSPGFETNTVTSQAVRAQRFENNNAAGDLPGDLAGLHVTAPEESAAVCRQCSLLVAPGDVVVTADRAGPGTFWHPACFVCSTCNELLVDLVYFHKDNKLFCGRHFAEEVNIPRCTACDELIFTTEYTLAEECYFHVRHFCCIECDVPLAGMKYISREGQPCCLDCFARKFAKTCNACKKLIGPSESSVIWQDLHWHADPRCFRCVACEKSLLNSKFAVRENQCLCSKECIRAFLLQRVTVL